MKKLILTLFFYIGSHSNSIYIPGRKYSKLFKNRYNIEISKNRAKPVLLEIQNNTCLMCDTKFSNKVPHEIHHIDHNSKNNIFSNYIALCSNCHSGIHRYNLVFPFDKYIKLFSTFKSKRLFLKMRNNTTKSEYKENKKVLKKKERAKQKNVARKMKEIIDM